MIKKDFFAKCDEQTELNYALSYSSFLYSWIHVRIPNSYRFDKIVIHFVDDKLQKVNLYKDFKLDQSMTRKEWLYPPSDLDSKDERPMDAMAQDFIENEERFVKRIKLSDYAYPLEDNHFVVFFNLSMEAK